MADQDKSKNKSTTKPQKKKEGIGSVIYKAGYYTVMHDGIEHAGYLAFLALLSIFPFLVFMFSIAASLGRQEIGAEFIAELQLIFPDDVALALMPRINEIISGPPQSLLTIAIIGIIWTASSAVEGLRTILNRAYRVMNPPIYIYRRLLSIAQFIVLTFIVIVATFFLTFAPNIIDHIEKITEFQINFGDDIEFFRFYVSAFLIFISIATSYYVLPNIKQSWLAVLPGAIIALIFWLIAAYIFSSYIAYYRQFNVVYGSLAGIIITLLFFYVLGVIYIFGAEFNYFYERSKGHKIIQKESSENIADKDEKEASLTNKN
jgi:membrane protein